MEPNRLSAVLHGVVVIALMGGVGLILLAGPLLTAVGVVLVIAGLIGLMPALRYWLDASEQSAAE